MKILKEIKTDANCMAMRALDNGKSTTSRCQFIVACLIVSLSVARGADYEALRRQQALQTAQAQSASQAIASQAQAAARAQASQAARSIQAIQPIQSNQEVRTRVDRSATVTRANETPRISETRVERPRPRAPCDWGLFRTRNLSTGHKTPLRAVRPQIQNPLQTQHWQEEM